MTDMNGMLRPEAGELPAWVPEAARRYLAHTESGVGIRDLSRQGGCHASTVLRQIRRIETQRDDPLVDAALKALAARFLSSRQEAAFPEPEESGATVRFEREAARVLPRLCEPGAVLAVAEGMEKAVVVRDAGAGGVARTAVVDMGTAQALALNAWIACPNPGRVSRYRITASGRAASSRIVAAAENRASTGDAEGFAEAQAGFMPAGPGTGGNGAPQRPRRVRYTAFESPLALLSRRRDRDGKPFLSADLVRAGERLREDFELAQMQEASEPGAEGGRGGGGCDAARARVARALADLGPGLSDVALRCCCHLEGLERVEKRMGWSARSGKIVLRIALQRLSRHYAGQPDRAGMIG